jgi:hypothetical protein
MYHSDIKFLHHISPDAALDHFNDEWFMNHHVWDADTTPYPLHPISGEEPEKIHAKFWFPGHARAVEQSTSSASSSVEYLTRIPLRQER